MIGSGWKRTVGQIRARRRLSAGASWHGRWHGVGHLSPMKGVISDQACEYQTEGADSSLWSRCGARKREQQSRGGASRRCGGSSCGLCSTGVAGPRSLQVFERQCEVEDRNVAGRGARRHRGAQRECASNDHPRARRPAQKRRTGLTSRIRTFRAAHRRDRNHPVEGRGGLSGASSCERYPLGA